LFHVGYSNTQCLVRSYISIPDETSKHAFSTTDVLVARIQIGTIMASPNDSEEIDEEKELERIQKIFLDQKKAVFEEAREADEKLHKIRQDEMVVQKRLQKIKEDKREVEKLRQTLVSLNIENAKLKELQATTSSALSSMKEKIAVCEREHGQAGDLNKMKRELETLTQQNVEQSASLRTVKDAMQRITGYSKTQQKEKEQALRTIASLKDEIEALRQISEETQQRQLNELQSSSSTKKQQQQQQRTGKFHELLMYS